MSKVYQGYFRSLHNNTLYTVRIRTEKGSGIMNDVSLGPSPFTTTMENGGGTIYSPVKSQSATVQIVADTSVHGYFFDFYSSTPKQNKVILCKGDLNINTSDANIADASIMFTGYISPNVYDSDYNHDIESWDVECVDGLSVLKNYDYVPADVTKKDFISFSKLIHNILSKCGCYKYWYISDALKVSEKASTSSFKTFDNLFISEQNFFDEEDTPMKMFEVLEEICKFFGVVAVADGVEVYFLDYDAIKGGVNTYWKYPINSSPKTISQSYTFTSSGVSKTHPLTITKESYTSTGSRLSLDTVYSKVTVKDSLYKVGSIIPSMFDDEDLQNVHYASEDNQNYDYDFTTTCMDMGEQRWSGQPGGSIWTSKEKAAEDDTYFKIKSKLYTNKKYIHKFYKNDSSALYYEWQENPTVIDSSHDSSSGKIPIQSPLVAENYLGAVMSKYSVGSGNTSSAASANIEFDSYENYLMITMNNTLSTGYAPDGSYGLPFLQSADEFSKPFFMSGKTRLIAKGELIMTDRGTFPNTSGNSTNIGYWPHTGTFVGDRIGYSEISFTKNALTLKVKVDIGDSSKYFDVPFYPYGEGTQRVTENKKTHEIFYTNFGVQDNIDYLDKIKENGYRLNMNLSEDNAYPAKTKITLFGMEQLKYLMTILGLGDTAIACVFLKDFDIVAQDPFEGPSSEINATDTEYSVEINSDYTSELSPISMKICTADGKALNYSSVAYKNGNTSTNYKFLDKFYHSTLTSQIQAAAPDADNGNKRAEQLLCFRLVNQYSEPSKKLNINLFNNLIKPYSLVTEKLSSSFIVASIANDYVTDTVTVDLVEKK